MNPRPKILYLTSYDLDWPDNGGTLRNRHLVRHLSRIGDVNVLLAGDFAFESPQRKATGGVPLLGSVQFQPTGKWSLHERLRNEFDPRFLNTDWYQARDEDRDRVQRQSVAHDLVWVHTLKLANRFNRWRWPATVLDIDDIPSSLCRNGLAAAETVGGKIRHLRQAILWRRRERFLTERFDAMTVCSEADKALLGGDQRVFVVPNGFEAPRGQARRQLTVPPRLGFVGNFKHEPNLDGIRWFSRKIWPLILRRSPTTRLRLAGAAAEELSHIPNVDILGWIADMESEMASWSTAIVPVRTGGGTRVKIAEAFSRRCPVVATTLGAYGYEVTSGLELWLADSPREFAAKCLRVLENPAEADAMADRACRKFLRSWTWDAQAERVDAVVESVLKKRAAWRKISQKNHESLQQRAGATLSPRHV
ncbi:MAG TPA: glycosyltransferase family 4 protein [Verrucomicrobiae bacterium]|nr:glycosyltransferase family 4 protein [Verrucomicrobiae bacterium]